VVPLAKAARLPTDRSKRAEAVEDSGIASAGKALGWTEEEPILARRSKRMTVSCYYSVVVVPSSSIEEEEA